MVRNGAGRHGGRGRWGVVAAGIVAAGAQGVLGASAQELPRDWRTLLTCMARSSYIHAIDFDLNLTEGTLAPKAGVDRAAFVKAHAGCVRQLQQPASSAGAGKAAGGPARAARTKETE